MTASASVMAQRADATGNVAIAQRDAMQIDSPAGEPGHARPSSTETGQSPLDASFGPRTYTEWVRETRRKAWQDTRFDVQMRSYALDREKFDDSQSEAWALGASAGLKTGYFRDRFAFGATGYTSQRLHGPQDKDGTLLLKPGQHGYSVLGELYGEFLVNRDTRLSIGRRGIDTPYLNRNDSRMSPNTFEAITLQGVYGGTGNEAEWRAGGGYVDAIKQRNADGFVSMANAAGAASGIERGVYVAGANYRKGDFSIGAIGYHSNDIINIFHAESKFAWPLGDVWRAQFALQVSTQRATGDHLLEGRDFTSNQRGGKFELGAGGALFSLAYATSRGDADMQSPWGGYPGYTGVQIEDFNRRGEHALMLRAAYQFQSVDGLSAYGLWVDGSDPSDPAQYARNEYDLNLQWTPASGRFNGLMIRLRYAHVEQDDPDRSELDDVRVMVYYNPRFH